MSDEGERNGEPTFAELFEADPATPVEDFRPGDTVSGEVIKITGEHVFVDLGGKSEGIAEAAEFLDEEGNLSVKVGDRVELKVTAVSEMVTLSKVLRVRGAEALEMLRDAHGNGLPVEGRVTGVNRGGLEVEISGIRAFCPLSQIDLGYCEEPEAHVGARYLFRVVEFKERGRNIVVSRRALLEEEREAMARETLAGLRVGDVREGRVTRLVDFGAFVDIGGVEGLLHVSEMAHHRVGHPSERVQVGETVKVQVLEFEPSAEGRSRLSLSMKALEPGPWERGLELREGQVLRGRVTRLADFGAFVEILPGVEGLVHVSEIAYGRVTHPRSVLREGEEVVVRILEVDADRRRVSLSIKEAEGLEPTEGSEVEGNVRGVETGTLQAGTPLDGVVEKVVSGGVLLRLPGAGPGVRGFLPAEEMDEEGSGRRRKKAPQPGTRLAVEVTAVEEGGRIRLSRRALVEREARKDYETDRSGRKEKERAFATFGDLFKDLKIPTKDS